MFRRWRVVAPPVLALSYDCHQLRAHTLGSALSTDVVEWHGAFARYAGRAAPVDCAFACFSAAHLHFKRNTPCLLVHVRLNPGLPPLLLAEVEAPHERHL